MYACAILFALMAFLSTFQTCDCPTMFENVWGLYFLAKTRYDMKGLACRRRMPVLEN
jgi:hypothetical protein